MGMDLIRTATMKVHYLFFSIISLDSTPLLWRRSLLYWYLTSSSNTKQDDFNEDGFDEYSRKRKRSKSKKKSEAAEKQEKAAIAAFDAQKKSTEIQVAKVCSQGDAQTNVTVQLLKPSEHLTGLCWSTFAKYVKQSPGWTAKRREATSAEKVEHKETRKHKCYFVDVIYTPVAGGKPAKEHSVPLPSKKKAKGAISSSSAKWKDGANTATAISVDDEPPTKKTKAVAS